MKINKIIFFFLIFLGLLLYLHNFIVYPPTRGGDSRDHIAYIKYLAEKWRIPKASEGLQMYQPPLYYSLAAIFYSFGKYLKLPLPLKISQLISLFSSLSSILLIFLIAKKIFKKKEVIMAIILFALFLPMSIYESPVVSNETLLAFFSTLSIYLFLTNDWGKKNIRLSFILGIFIGLACLTKYTGLIIFLSTTVNLFLYSLLKKQKNYLINAIFLIITVIIFAGWFYIRQFILFGNPLILANDPKLFPYWQEPGYRDLAFYINLNGIFPLNVFGGQMKSFWGGTYNTIWIDAHHTFLPIMEFSRAGAIIIYLALVPIGVMLTGLIQTIRSVLNDIFRRGRENKKINTLYLSLAVFNLLAFFSYALYTYKLPFGSSIKAFYLLNNILPISIFFGFGLEKMIKWLKNYRWLLYLELFTLIIFIYKLYWYQSWWKNIGE